MANSCGQNKATNDKCDSKRDRQRKNNGQNPANKSHDAPDHHPWGGFLYNRDDRLSVQIPILQLELVTPMEKDANCRESKNRRKTTRQCRSILLATFVCCLLSMIVVTKTSIKEN